MLVQASESEMPSGRWGRLPQRGRGHGAGKMVWGAKDSKGEQLYPGGVPLGSEAYWPLWLTGLPTGQGALIPAFGNDFVCYMGFEPDPGPS